MFIQFNLLQPLSVSKSNLTDYGTFTDVKDLHLSHTLYMLTIPFEIVAVCIEQ